MDTWKSYFKKLLCKDKIDKHVGLIDDDTYYGKEPKIETKKVEKAIRMLKKATGGMLKNLGMNELQVLE